MLILRATVDFDDPTTHKPEEPTLVNCVIIQQKIYWFIKQFHPSINGGTRENAKKKQSKV